MCLKAKDFHFHSGTPETVISGAPIRSRFVITKVGPLSKHRRRSDAKPDLGYIRVFQL